MSLLRGIFTGRFGHILDDEDERPEDPKALALRHQQMDEESRLLHAKHFVETPDYIMSRKPGGFLKLKAVQAFRMVDRDDGFRTYDDGRGIEAEPDGEHNLEFSVYTREQSGWGDERFIQLDVHGKQLMYYRASVRARTSALLPWLKQLVSKFKRDEPVVFNETRPVVFMLSLEQRQMLAQWLRTLVDEGYIEVDTKS